MIGYLEYLQKTATKEHQKVKQFSKVAGQTKNPQKLINYLYAIKNHLDIEMKKINNLIKITTIKM